MEIKKYTTANKEAWNEVMPKHQKASKDYLDKLFSQKGFIIQSDPDLLNLFSEISVKNKNVIHLCCNNGIELLSIKNMGAAKCVGIDISEIAIEEAKERAEKFSIGCEFLCSDVFDIPQEYYNSFDIVHITSGCLGWIPDINLFFNICRKLLTKGGVFLIHEIHPFSEMLPFDSNPVENRMQIIEPYFRDEPVVENSSLDYIGKTQYEAKTQYWFVHTISALINSLSANGFIVKRFIESEKDLSAGHGEIEKLNAGIPLGMIILAEKL